MTSPFQFHLFSLLTACNSDPSPTVPWAALTVAVPFYFPQKFLLSSLYGSWSNRTLAAEGMEASGEVWFGYVLGLTVGPRKAGAVCVFPSLKTKRMPFNQAMWRLSILLMYNIKSFIICERLRQWISGRLKFVAQWRQCKSSMGINKGNADTLHKADAVPVAKSGNYLTEEISYFFSWCMQLPYLWLVGCCK